MRPSESELRSREDQDQTIDLGLLGKDHDLATTLVDSVPGGTILGTVIAAIEVNYSESDAQRSRKGRGTLAADCSSSRSLPFAKKEMEAEVGSGNQSEKGRIFFTTKQIENSILNHFEILIRQNDRSGSIFYFLDLDLDFYQWRSTLVYKCNLFFLPFASITNIQYARTNQVVALKLIGTK